MPSSADTPKATMMHDQARFTRLSVAEDYAGPVSGNQTAQARIHATDKTTLRGGSHWETLVRDPALDTDPSTRSRRTWFDAFKGITPPARVADLKFYAGVYCGPRSFNAACITPAAGETPQEQIVPEAERVTEFTAFEAAINNLSGGENGADAVNGQEGAFQNFEVVFADSPLPIIGDANAAPRGAEVRSMLVIDPSLDTNNVQFAVEIAKGAVNTAEATDKMGLMLSNAATPRVELTTMNAAGKAAILAALDAYQAAAGTPTTFNLSGEYDKALARLKSNRTIGDAVRVDVITGRNRTVSASLIGRSRAERIPVNVLTLSTWYPESTPVVLSRPSPTDMIPVSQLATMTGGSTLSGKNPQNVIAKISQNAKEDSGTNEAELASNTFLPKGASSQTTTFKLHPLDGDTVEAAWFFNPADASKLKFSLISPSGQVVTRAFTSTELADGEAIIEIDNSSALSAGTWMAVVTSSGATSAEIEFTVVAETEVDAEAEVTGLDAKQKPTLEAYFGSSSPISKADVRAAIYVAETGVLVRELVLRDDGFGGDQRANDGLYSVSLDNLLPKGNYDIEIKAETTAQSLFENDGLIFTGGNPNVTGSAPAGTLVGAGLVRYSEASMTLSADTVGVNNTMVPNTVAPPPASIPAPQTSDSGGGCTVNAQGNDAGLLLWFLLAALVLFMRRRGLALRDNE